MGLPRGRFLYPILDVDRLAGRTLDELVRVMGTGGVSIVQLRAKRSSDADRLRLVRAARAATEIADVALVVNDRADIARLVGAEGVHVGQNDMKPTDARQLLPEGLIGVSTHDQQQLEAALAEPVDYVAVGPVFATRSKTDPDPVVGLDAVRWARAATDLPIVAIGGIDRGNAPAVLDAGADGLAVISDLLSASDLGEALAEYRELLG